MTFTFDESEYGPGQPQPKTTVTQAAVDDLFAEPEEAQDEWESQMSEVERRLEKAQYYRTLMSQALFEADSEAGREVEAEVREFVKSRMAVLVGASPERTASANFTAEEIRVLKEVAAKLNKNAKLMPETKEPPKVNVVRNQTAPTVKPVAAPVAPKAPPRAPKPPKPAPKSTPAEKSPIAGKKIKPLDEVIVMRSGENGPEMKFRKVQTPRGVGYLGEDGQEYTLKTNEAGQAFMRNEGVQVQVAKGNPTPTAHQYAMIAAQHAQTAVSSTQNSPLAGALTQVLKGD